MKSSPPKPKKSRREEREEQERMEQFWREHDTDPRRQGPPEQVGRIMPLIEEDK